MPPRNEKRLTTRTRRPAGPNTNYRRRWRIVRGYTIGWITAFVFLAFVRGSGTVEEGSAQFDAPEAMALAAVFGLVFGTLAGSWQVIVEERFYRRVPLRRLLGLRLLGAVLFLNALNLAGYVYVTTTRGVEMGFIEFTLEPGAFAIYFYMLAADTFLVALRQVNLMLGEGNLWRLIRGVFYTPREMELIVMFLDLRDSTATAERLGHLKYSRLIQDCFDDLGVVADHEARVYQYLGDGAVLVWSIDRGLLNRNCLAAWFRFRRRLEARDAYYRSTYDCAPRFTAGAHVGIVTATEVGRFKKEIAYHGDTLNTAARIQAQCKNTGRDFLISQSLLDRLNEHSPGDRYEYNDVGPTALRGKDEEITLVAVDTR